MIPMDLQKEKSKATTAHNSFAARNEAFGYASVRARAKEVLWVIRLDAHGPSPTSLPLVATTQPRCSFFSSEFPFLYSLSIIPWKKTTVPIIDEGLSFQEAHITFLDKCQIIKALSIYIIYH